MDEDNYFIDWLLGKEGLSENGSATIPSFHLVTGCDCQSRMCVQAFLFVILDVDNMCDDRVDDRNPVRIMRLRYV